MNSGVNWGSEQVTFVYSRTCFFKVIKFRIVLAKGLVGVGEGMGVGVMRRAIWLSVISI